MHGARFAADGTLLEGPAVEDLPRLGAEHPGLAGAGGAADPLPRERFRSAYRPRTATVISTIVAASPIRAMTTSGRPVASTTARRRE